MVLSGGALSGASRASEKGAVLVVADVTPEGREVVPATPEQPVYYVAASGGIHEFGAVAGGVKPPARSGAEESVRVALARQGYLPAGPGTPLPTVFIFFIWGTMNPDDSEADPESEGAVVSFNRTRMLGFMGIHKVADLPMISATRERVFDATREWQYFIGVAAYDYASMVEQRRQLLWTTRISLESRRYEMSDAIPTMLESGRAFFGRESSRPQWIGPRERRGEVKLGDLIIHEFMSEKKEGSATDAVPLDPAAKSPAK